MKRSKIAATMAGALAIATLYGTSAFAESRHRDETKEERRSEDQNHSRPQRQERQPRAEQGDNSGSHNERAHGSDRSDNSSRDRSQPRDWNRDHSSQPRDTNRDHSSQPRDTNRDRSSQPRDWNRDRSSQPGADWNRNHNSQHDNDWNRSHSQSSDWNRNRTYGSGSSWNRNRSYGSYRTEGSRRPTYYSGRVSRYVHERGGYRVWLDSGRNSFWLPEIRFSSWPLRVGLSLRLGGFYDPRGYVDVYDVGGYGGRPIYTSGELHGLVESVDYRGGTLELRDEISGEFVTVVVTGNDPRLMDLRQGDYVELSGDWSRGIFRALRLEDLRDGASYRNDDYRDGRY